MRVSARRLALLSILLGMATAWSTPVPGLAQEEPKDQAVDVTVENRAATPARVYVLQEGHMVPLGLVEAGASENLQLPPLFAESDEPIQLVADMIGAAGWYKSDPMSVGGTAAMELTIESDPAGLAIAVR